MDNMIAVAASSQDDELCGFSNYGMAVDLCAPAVDIMTTATYWNWEIEEGWFTEYGYENWSGSSAAVPHVTAAAALLKSVDPELTAAEIKDIILNNVDLCPALNGLVFTGGRLNIFKALSSIAPVNTITFDNPIEYFYDGEIEEWIVSCPLTALLPGNYLITAEAVVLGVEYDPNDPGHEGYYEYVDQNEFLSGTDIIKVIFPEGLTWYYELIYEITVKVFDSGSNLLASDVCYTEIIQPKKK